MTWYNQTTLALGSIESSKNSQSGRIFGKNGAGSKIFNSLRS